MITNTDSPQFTASGNSLSSVLFLRSLRRLYVGCSRACLPSPLVSLGLRGVVGGETSPFSRVATEERAPVVVRRGGRTGSVREYRLPWGPFEDLNNQRRG